MYNEEFFTNGSWDGAKEAFGLLGTMISEADESDVTDAGTVIKSFEKLTQAIRILMQIVDDSRDQLLKEREEHGKGV